MTIKEKMLQVVHALPEDTSIEEAMERLLFLAKVEKGLEQADAGETLSHEEVKERMSRWLK
jgi:predicted transcriptional regulator